MSRQPSWRLVANRLAERMRYHSDCSVHPEDEAEPDNCATCKDRAAYQLWVGKARHVRRSELMRAQRQ